MGVKQNQPSTYTVNWSEEKCLYSALVTGGKENCARDHSLFSWYTNRTIIVEESCTETT